MNLPTPGKNPAGAHVCHTCIRFSCIVVLQELDQLLLRWPRHVAQVKFSLSSVTTYLSLTLFGLGYMFVPDNMGPISTTVTVTYVTGPKTPEFGE